MDSAEPRDTYAAYHAGRPANRDDLLRNPEVLFQKLAADAALYRALNRVHYDISQTVLDVGGGSGGSLVPFIELGALPSRLASVDMLQENTDSGRRRFPGVAFHNCDAREMPFGNAQFDLVYASTMFGPIMDATIDVAIGKEMLRVVKPGGHILVRDWALNNFLKRGSFGAITPKRIERIFGRKAAFSEVAALPPPLGRRLSHFAPWLYFAAQLICPAGQRVYVLKV